MKRIIWKNEDGTIRISTPDVSKKLESETEAEFYQRQIEKWKTILPELASLDNFLIEENKIPKDRTNRGKFRLSADNKKVVIDKTVETEEDKKMSKRQSAKTKLINGEPLSEDEAKEILGL